MTHQLRVVGIEGPGNAIESFRYWRSGCDNPNTMGIPYSHQFFDVCDALNAKVLFISHHPRIERVEDGNFIVENRGQSSTGKSGIRYHAAEIDTTRRLIQEILRFRADVVVTTWFPYTSLLGCLRALGVRCVVRLHCTLWPKFIPPRRIRHAFHRVDGWFLRHCDAVMCVSEEVKRQVRTLTGQRSPRFVDFHPCYRRATFANITPPNHMTRPFRVLFTGRIERNKGVFDVLQLAIELRRRGRHDIVFELCGSGSDFASLRQAVSDAHLENTFVLRGWCNHHRMRESLSRAHIVIVPTRTDFIEGLPGTITESLLAGRPVLTSAVCPAVEYVKDAVVCVAPENVDAYLTEIIRLADDQTHYSAIQSQCIPSAECFMNPEVSFGHALKHVLTAIARGGAVPRRESVLPISTDLHATGVVNATNPGLCAPLALATTLHDP